MTKRWITFLGAGLLIAASGVGLYDETQVTTHVVMAQQEAQEGQELFASLCQTCHGPGGDGAGGAPVLNDGVTVTKYANTSALAQFIQSRMPATNPGILSPSQARNLAWYIIKLNHRLPGNP
ncbi:c-type cytochrome [Sulfobacillus sp. hq2]|uniref:Cytochrome c domain-containing protein n=1 Tax=Sulfobacillus thermotolerans TaxID=338644 RepID=A0ABM6RTV1_9FIRM|nr:c-type cytochrome [Sulfobacillus sp. hq2]AUW94780.1 hypothetical protein BXT84_13175 [Sulfobacillus thermotolerans]MCY0907847.1 c-type cytochrome [Sulfobacillus thermotolerans]POB09788.1 cytochrome C [Sulfobacillus sp. hq2]